MSENEFWKIISLLDTDEMIKLLDKKEYESIHTGW